MKKQIISVFIALTSTLSVHSQTGIGTNTPNSDLEVKGAVALAVRSSTGATSLDINDNVLLFTGTSSATITLPIAVTCTGRIYWIKNASTTLPVPICTIATSVSETIEGQSTWLLDEPNEVIRLVSDGSSWQVYSQNVAVRKTTTIGTPWIKGGNNLKSIKSVGVIENYGFSFITNNVPRVHLSSSGYIGLGNSSPSGRFHSITDNDDNSNDYYLQDHGASITQGIFMRKARGTIVIPVDLQNGDLIGQFRFSGRYNGSLVTSGGSGLDANYTGTGTSVSSDFRFFSSNAEAMRIQAVGYTGIGTSSFDATNPERLLVDAGVTSSYNVISGKGDIDNYLQLNIKNSSSGTSASSDIVATADNGNESVNFIDMGINSSGYNNATIPILDGLNNAYVYASGNDMKIGTSSSYDVLLFTGGFATSNERLRITASGNVGIGAIAIPADKLTVAGILSPSADNTYTIGKSGTRWSSVWSANGTIQTSDARLKRHIRPLEYGIRTIMKLEPIHYEWKKDNLGKIGLIAQSVQNLVPEVVIGNEATDFLGMNYAELVPVLIKALQEQQAQLQLLQKDIQKLKKVSNN